MFANLNKVMFELYHFDQKGVKIKFNPWDYLPHTYFTMGLLEARVFIRYVETFHHLRLSGLLRVWKNNTYTTYQVQDNELVD